jgi:hypothetical protein
MFERLKKAIYERKRSSEIKNEGWVEEKSYAPVIIPTDLKELRGLAKRLDGETVLLQDKPSNPKWVHNFNFKRGKISYNEERDPDILYLEYLFRSSKQPSREFIYLEDITGLMEEH